MRILHLLKHASHGNGSVHVAVDLACAQADAGHHVAVASSGGAYDDLLREHGVEVIFLPRAEKMTSTVRSQLDLLRSVRRVRPDVIHAHMMSSAVLGFVASRMFRTPLMTTVHNSFDWHSSLMRLGKTVVAVSDAERRLLISRGFPARKVITVLNGALDSSRERLVDAEENAETMVAPSVATLSGLHRRKGLDVVITAFADVLTDLPDRHLYIIGDGPDRDRLGTMVSELGLSERVHFLGATLAPRPLLEKADVFVTAARAEPCGLAVAEARAAGCAIIASDVGGNPELLDHGQAGQLFPSEDASALARALRQLLADAPLRQRWQSRAADGCEHLTVRRMADDYIAAYEQLVDGRRLGVRRLSAPHGHGASTDAPHAPPPPTRA